MSEAIAPMGHNHPPGEIELIASRNADDFDRAATLAGHVLPAKIEQGDVATFETVVDIRQEANKLAKALGDLRLKEQRPFQEKVEQTRLLFVPHIQKLETVVATAGRIVTAYQQEKAEAERKAAAEAAEIMRQEAERRRLAADQLFEAGHEAAADGVAQTSVQADQQAARMEQMAAGKTADLVRTHTGSATVSTRTAWAFKVENEAALRKTLGKLGGHFTTAEIEKAARSFMNASVKAGATPENPPALAGVMFWRGETASFR